MEVELETRRLSWNVAVVSASGAAARKFCAVMGELLGTPTLSTGTMGLGVVVPQTCGLVDPARNAATRALQRGFAEAFGDPAWSFELCLTPLEAAQLLPFLQRAQALGEKVEDDPHASMRLKVDGAIAIGEGAEADSAVVTTLTQVELPPVILDPKLTARERRAGLPALPFDEAAPEAYLSAVGVVALARFKGLRELIEAQG